MKWDERFYNYYSYQRYLDRKRKQQQYDLVLMACMLMILALAAVIIGTV